jgi:hypothetical protein
MGFLWSLYRICRPEMGHRPRGGWQAGGHSGSGTLASQPTHGTEPPGSPSGPLGGFLRFGLIGLEAVELLYERAMTALRR